jgi:beta-ketodecanoyl-[acyl-carrier-protein] synthase
MSDFGQARVMFIAFSPNIGYVTEKGLLNMTTNLSPKIVISGSGIWTPSDIITNDELVDSYNAYAERFNSINAADIASGKIKEKPLSSARFIDKTS